MSAKKNPVGVYDSGVGGLSVLREINRLLPNENLIYFGDQAKVPYGGRPIDELRSLAEGVTRFLLKQNCKSIVIACNTASAAALKYLRALYPGLPFVGMEPAVKPAAELTRSGKVGVLATPSTFAGTLYASVVERFAHDVEVFQHTCPGLVSQIERGYLDTPKTRQILETAIQPMLESGVDTLVMGCTHYPFVIPTIEKITHRLARVIDPAPAVARQLKRVLEQADLLNPGVKAGNLTFYTSGDSHKFAQRIAQLIRIDVIPNQVRWVEQDLKQIERTLR